MGGSRSDASLSVPDSLGGQLGFEYSFPLQNEGFLTANLECLYTSPYLYVKQSPNWSLFRSRHSPNMDGYVNTWIGSPFGPDCFALQLYAKYNPISNWDISFGYLFKIHGENNAVSLFSNTYDSEKGIYTYYPSVEYEIAQENGDSQGMTSAKNKGRFMWMTGNAEYTHQIAVKAIFSPVDKLKFTSQLIYDFIFNHKNQHGNFQHGFEFSFAAEYSLF